MSEQQQNQKLVGTVKFWAHPKPDRNGFGFIVMADGVEVYCHQSRLTRAKIDRLRTGNVVRFTTRINPNTGKIEVDQLIEIVEPTASAAPETKPALQPAAPKLPPTPVQFGD